MIRRKLYPTCSGNTLQWKFLQIICWKHGCPKVCRIHSFSDQLFLRHFLKPALLSHENWLNWKTAEPSRGHLKWDQVTNYISGYDDMNHHLRDDAEIEVCMDKPYVNQESVTNSCQCVFQWIHWAASHPSKCSACPQRYLAVCPHTHLLHCFKIVQLVWHKIYIQNGLPSRWIAESGSDK